MVRDQSQEERHRAHWIYICSSANWIKGPVCIVFKEARLAAQDGGYLVARPLVNVYSYIYENNSKENQNPFIVLQVHTFVNVFMSNIFSFYQYKSH